MIDNLPAAPDPASDTPQQFNAKAAAFVLAQKAMVGQINSTAANMNSIAVGGAYGLPYVWGSGINVGGNPSQNSTPLFAITNSTAGGWSALSQLQQFDASSSVVKGQMRVIAAADPSRYINFNVLSRTDSGTYQVVNGAVTGASATNPFNNGDLVLVFFQRTGDVGSAAALQSVIVRDQKAANAAPQTLTQNAWTRRVLNTLVGNQIAGFQLGAYAANTFTLQKGSYWIDATAPAKNPNGHQLRLFNVTQNATYDIGGSDYFSVGNSSIPSTGRAVLRTFLTISADTVYAIEHYVSSTCDGGQSGGAGIGEIYTELRIVKVG